MTSRRVYPGGFSADAGRRMAEAGNDLRFDYQILAGTALPLCEIKLVGPGGWTPVRVLVDSGATLPVLPRGTADAVGLRLSDFANDSVQYGGSRVSGWRHDAGFFLGDEFIRTAVVFVETLDIDYGLLGRVGVFERFREVSFLERLNTPRVEFRR